MPFILGEWVPPILARSGVGPDSIVLRDVANECLVTYHANYLGRGEADRLYAELSSGGWVSDRPKMFGKVYETRRKTRAFGSVGYTYNGSVSRTPEAFSGELELLRGRVAESVGAVPNSCLANLYPDGLAGLGAHADNEPGIEAGSPIVGISLGGKRRFVFLDRSRPRKKVAEVYLEHGSCLVMWWQTQKHYLHCIPTTSVDVSPRISLTFRVMA